MSPRITTVCKGRLPLGWRLWLCAAMFFVQSLALVHGISHGLPVGRLAPAAEAQTLREQGPGLVQEQGVSSASSEWFSGHQDSFKCRLLDHLADHGLVLHVPLSLRPDPQTPVRNDFHEERLSTRLIAAFQARGPPTTS